MAGFVARLVEHEAADGSKLYDLVVDLPDGTDPVLYRGVDREHVDSVRTDLAAGRLEPMAVQAVFREVILPRAGRPQPVFIRGVPVPLSWGKGAAGDRWAEARRRIETLRKG
jgi:hypothetical protein